LDASRHFDGKKFQNCCVLYCVAQSQQLFVVSGLVNWWVRLSV